MGSSLAHQFVGSSRPRVGEVASELVGLRLRLRKQAQVRGAEAQLAFARTATGTVVSEFWSSVATGGACVTPLRLPPVPIAEVSDEGLSVYGRNAAALPLVQAFFEIGELYTALLPDDYRTRHGVYYTPPTLVERLLDLLEAEGADWRTARVLDPACGGAAFLAFVAQRMLAANVALPAEARLRDLKDRLVGIELDPFAAWLAKVFLDTVCLPLVEASDRRVEGLIRTGDTLLQPEEDLGEFDVIVGNPPYGKVSLPEEQRHRFKRSLFGHANIYGVFTDLAVRHTKGGGLIGFVTPTSFLGGEYFKNLRHLLVQEAPPARATFIADREGVFADVLQETMLAVFRRRITTTKRSRRHTKPAVTVELMQPDRSAKMSLTPLGRIELQSNSAGPWVLPRASNQTRLIRALAKLPVRLSDYGYRVATGQLVWNRHKSQFTDFLEAGCFPVLWAECIKPDGTFEFRAENRDHRPFIHLEPHQDFLVNYEPCVLVQRTTSKEQARRLVATVVSNEFVVEYPGYVAENHVNMLIPARSKPPVSLALLARLLNSGVLDSAFRCISGSVAVSAYELESLPLPDPARLVEEMRRQRVRLTSVWFDAFLEEVFCRGT